jgi:hypothetical protein
MCGIAFPACIPTCIGSYLNIRDETNIFSSSDFLLLGGMQHDAFQTSIDPMADLLSGLHGAAPFAISGAWGKLRGEAWFQCSIHDTEKCVHVSTVPLPATAWLLGSALAGLLLMKKYRPT